MAKKYYAVKNGFNIGIFSTWEECKKNVDGYSGAEYKSFKSEKEAKAYIGILNEVDKKEELEVEVIAYVDGSYNDLKKEYSYGAVIFHNGEEQHFCEKFSNKSLISMRNVAGEIEGSKRAIKYCLDNNAKSVAIYYDYEGIEKWCTGAWKAKKEGTKEYKDYYDEAKKTIEIKFIKIKGHSGDKYNDLADELAKRALGISDSNEPLKCNGKGIVASNIRFEDYKSIVELLQEDFEELKVSEKKIPYGIQYNIENKNQTIIVRFYTDKNKLVLEGNRETELFNRLTKYIIELLELDEIPEFLNTVHNLNIDTDLVEDEFTRYFPNSHDKLPKDLSKYLHQAVYNLHIMGNMYVYNYLVEPAIRPLEAVLKIALQDNDIPIRKPNKEYDSFFVFDEDGDKYKLKDKYIKDTHKEEFLNYISEITTYFKRNRNTLFHWDNPKDEPDTSRILNTVEEAHIIIKDSIKLIDKYYEVCKF
ncbi:ribonuclease H1 domain-containing protein [Clostridium perfringens]|uniref:ribonuclease H1 domain-containing protein n=1 Tax=Clostridium perfringens TaxID=1502 RepID=UPI00396AFAD1